MKKALVISLLAGASLLSVAHEADAARRVVVHRGPRGHVTRVRVTTHAGFPIRRTFPTVVVRGPVIRVAPRVYLSPLVFTPVIVTVPAPAARVWTSSETLDREDGWTDFSMDVDQRGRSLVLEIDRGAAQVSFAEVVFENGDAQVIDFNDKVHRTGVYSLVDFKDGRKVDHVRILAKADTNESVIQVHLVS